MVCAVLIPICFLFLPPIPYFYLICPFCLSFLHFSLTLWSAPVSISSFLQFSLPHIPPLQKTHYVSITNMNLYMLFRETTTVYSKNHAKCIHTLLGKMYSFCNSEAGGHSDGYCNLWKKVLIYWLNDICFFWTYHLITSVSFLAKYQNFSVHPDNNT
jgi:hypothetical protein